MVKEILRLDDFYSSTKSLLGYSESYLFRSLQMFSLSLFLPAFSKLNWQKGHRFFIKLFLIFFAIITITSLVIVGEASFYKTIYIDCILGLMFAYCVSLVYYEKELSKFGIFRLSIGLSFLLLTKQMGLAFFALTLGILILNYINRKKI